MGYDDAVDARGAYDAMAAAYVADETNAYNSLYERPAMLELLGAVAGLRVLDLGCGAGALAAELVARGARVVGVDVSPAMVAAAQARVDGAVPWLGAAAGPEQVGASFLVGDALELARGFGDGTFDVVAASLMMHYVRDWDAVLGELARVVVPGGSMVLSTHHPELIARTWPQAGAEQGKDVVLIYDRWTKGGAEFDVRFYARSFALMERGIAGAGWTLEKWVMPQPLAACEGVDPVAWERLTRLPWFVFGVLRRAARAG